MTANPNFPLFDPNSEENPEVKHFMLMRPDNGELVSPERARQERRIAEATARRVVVPLEWGPKSSNLENPEGLTYSA